MVKAELQPKRPPIETFDEEPSDDLEVLEGPEDESNPFEEKSYASKLSLIYRRILGYIINSETPVYSSDLAQVLYYGSELNAESDPDIPTRNITLKIGALRARLKSIFGQDAKIIKSERQPVKGGIKKARYSIADNYKGAISDLLAKAREEVNESDFAFTAKDIAKESGLDEEEVLKLIAKAKEKNPAIEIRFKNGKPFMLEEDFAGFVTAAKFTRMRYLRSINALGEVEVLRLKPLETGKKRTEEQEAEAIDLIKKDLGEELVTRFLPAIVNAVTAYNPRLDIKLEENLFIILEDCLPKQIVDTESFDEYPHEIVVEYAIKLFIKTLEKYWDGKNLSQIEDARRKRSIENSLIAIQNAGHKIGNVVVAVCKRYKMPIPENYQQHESSITKAPVKFRPAVNTDSADSSTPYQKAWGNICIGVADLRRKNPDISVNQIAEELGKTPRAIQMALTMLKNRKN